MKHRQAGRGWVAVVPLVTAVLYGVSPIDLVPDILLLVGWVDDGAVGVLMALMSVWLFFRSRNRARSEPAYTDPCLPAPPAQY